MQSSALTVVHKYIRSEMFRLAQTLSSASPNDLDTVRSSIDAVAMLLRGHAEHEDAVFAPQLQAVDASYARRMSDDHRRLDEELDRICQAAHALDGTRQGADAALLRLHLDWNRFTGDYLAHLDDEERTLFPALGDALPPVSFIAEGAAARGEEGARAFLETLWKVVTPAERAAIESAFESR